MDSTEPDLGCYFCGREDGKLVFESGRGANVHPLCVRDVLIDDPSDDEANAMAYLLT